MKKDYLMIKISSQRAEKKIGKLEHEIIELKKELQIRRDPFSHLEQQYLEEKKKIEELNDELTDSEIELDQIVRYVKNIPDDEVIRVVRGTSNLVRKANSADRIDWVGVILGILKKENRFLTFEEIRFNIFKLHPELDSETKVMRVRMFSLHDNMKRSDEKMRLRKEKGKGLDNRSFNLVWYQQKYFGLMTWCDDNLIPKPAYMKQFMYAKDKNAA